MHKGRAAPEHSKLLRRIYPNIVPTDHCFPVNLASDRKRQQEQRELEEGTATAHFAPENGTSVVAAKYHDRPAILLANFSKFT